ncbi:hypothetical protein ACJIZ3_003698 [Penstemon smallii]|uniref:Uncharacterized protein n=1 Tax=Penstemon smallii TaxID=265156 RepID=A0ABD3UD25_9LAMI
MGCLSRLIIVYDLVLGLEVLRRIRDTGILAYIDRFKGRISRVDIKGEPVVAQHKHTSID